MNCFDKIINSTRPDYIYIAGKEVFNNLIYTNLEHFTGTCNQFKDYTNSYEQIKEIDIYIDIKHEKFNIVESVLYSSYIIYSLDSQISGVENEKPEEIFIQDINSILHEVIKYWNLKEILKKKDMKCNQTYITDSDEITRSIDYHSRVLIINNGAKYYGKQYEINIYAINGDMWKNMNTNLDILKIYLDSDNRYNFYLKKEILVESIKNKIINIDLNEIIENLKKQDAGINNKYMKNIIEEIKYYIGLNWFIYLKTNKCYTDINGKECDRICECMLRLNLETIKEFHFGLIISKFYIKGELYMLINDNKIVKINNWEGKQYLQNVWNNIYYLERYIGENLSKDSEDNSYKNFNTIFNKMIMNKEYKQYIENPKNFIKFKLQDMYFNEKE